MLVAVLTMVLNQASWPPYVTVLFCVVIVGAVSSLTVNPTQRRETTAPDGARNRCATPDTCVPAAPVVRLSMLVVVAWLFSDTRRLEVVTAPLPMRLYVMRTSGT